MKLWDEIVMCCSQASVLDILLGEDVPGAGGGQDRDQHMMGWCSFLRDNIRYLPAIEKLFKSYGPWKLSIINFRKNILLLKEFYDFLVENYYVIFAFLTFD